ncbi:putative glycerate kinase protein [Eutypa lata UCREL1]|uniref:Putative glycerate kinase protein n=1 Tax=Eutypa lata (strain UCR-EL1) TaxID=1287681 RepID=M7S703_EUTLA|nr:putative glycerate kinase protein [Eutypa lata UCREL1]
MQHLLMHYKKLLTLPFHNLGICHPQRSPSDPSQGLRILIAPSGFKECLGPEEVADCIEAGFRRVLVDENDDTTTTTTTATPGVLRKVPLHDGGEGFCKAIVALHGGEIRNLTVTGPDRRPVDSYFGLIADAEDRKVAVLDMAAAAGLRLVPRDHRDPCVTTTYGVGELIRAALDEGCTKVIIGCGDSGTSDAGAGMLQALGARLLDGDGADLEIGGGGGSLADLERISLDGIHPRLRKDGGKEKVQIEAICNVKNILCGPSGVARVYGPQKGATPEQVETLSDLSRLPGSGASGGLGAGLLVLGAQLRGRAEAMDEYFQLESLFDEPWDLVVTAEGSLDYQSAKGKMTVEIAKRAKNHGIPVIVLAGTIGPGAESVYGTGIRSFLSILDRPLSLDEAITDAKRLLEDGAERAMRTIRLGMSLRWNSNNNSSSNAPSSSSSSSSSGASTPKTPRQHLDGAPTFKELTENLVKSQELDGMKCSKLMNAI